MRALTDALKISWTHSPVAGETCSHIVAMRSCVVVNVAFAFSRRGLLSFSL